jgi:hypothetical protein
MCRKAHGAAFRSRARVNSRDFKWVQGEERITWYQSSPGTYRGFCSVCGSALLTRFERDSTYFGLPLGALDTDPKVKPKLHVFVGSKAPWYDIVDDLPQFDEEPK